MADIHESISRSIIGLLLKEPFFAHLLGSIPRVVSDRTGTIGLEIQPLCPRLLVNETYFLETLQSDEERRAAIKHEALHLAFSHFMRRTDRQVHEVFDIATDLVVNQYFCHSELPQNAITISCYPNLRLRHHETVDYYYDALINHHVRCSSTLSEDREQEGQSLQSIKQIEADKGRGSHQHWGQEKQSTRYTVEKLILAARDRTPIQRRGTIPGGVSQLFDLIAQDREPQVDWKRQLRLFGTNSRRTRVAHTMKRISKRYATRPGIKVKRHQKLLIAIDTSGSIDDDALQMFFAEVYGLWRSGAEITVIECDCEIRRSYLYRGETPTDISGGGGTDFDPVFQYVLDRPNERYDGILYLTDGYASKPQIQPPYNVLWVITPDGTSDSSAFGRAIKLTS